MKARFTWAAAAVAFTLAPALAPVWCAPTSDTTTTVKDDARTAGHAVAHGATTVGHTVADKSRETGHAIADHTRSARDTVRDDSKKAGHAIADSARKVGRTVREGFQKLKTGTTGKSSEPAPKS
jgi:predicted methyltransferase